jgi:hypothetical protein
MNPEVIRKKVPTIPISDLGIEPSDGEIWEQKDGAAHFKVIRHQLHSELGKTMVEMISLSISGPVEDRLRIRADFVEAFERPPDASDRLYVRSGPLDTFAWCEGTLKNNN